MALVVTFFSSRNKLEKKECEIVSTITEFYRCPSCGQKTKKRWPQYFRFFFCLRIYCHTFRRYLRSQFTGFVRTKIFSSFLILFFLVFINDIIIIHYDDMRYLYIRYVQFFPEKRDALSFLSQNNSRARSYFIILLLTALGRSLDMQHVPKEYYWKICKLKLIYTCV